MYTRNITKLLFIFPQTRYNSFSCSQCIFIRLYRGQGGGMNAISRQVLPKSYLPAQFLPKSQFSYQSQLKCSKSKFSLITPGPSSSKQIRCAPLFWWKRSMSRFKVGTTYNCHVRFADCGAGFNKVAAMLQHAVNFSNKIVL